MGIAAITPDMADVVIKAITNRRKAAAPEDAMQRKWMFRACLQLNRIGTMRISVRKNAMPLRTTLTVSIGGKTAEVVSVLANWMSIRGSRLGGLIAFEEHTKFVVVFL